MTEAFTLWCASDSFIVRGIRRYSGYPRTEVYGGNTDDFLSKYVVPQMVYTYLLGTIDHIERKFTRHIVGL